MRGEVHEYVLFFCFFYLLKVEFLEHGNADLVVQANFYLKLFDPKFGDPLWKENIQQFEPTLYQLP